MKTIFNSEEATENLLKGDNFWNCLAVYYGKNTSWQEKFSSDERLTLFQNYLPIGFFIMAVFNEKEEIYIERICSNLGFLDFKSFIKLMSIRIKTGDFPRYFYATYN